MTAGEFETGQFAYISVQNETEHGGVGCKIKVDGKVIDQATSDGAYVIASCSA